MLDWILFGFFFFTLINVKSLNVNVKTGTHILIGRLHLSKFSVSKCMLVIGVLPIESNRGLHLCL